MAARRGDVEERERKNRDRVEKRRGELLMRMQRRLKESKEEEEDDDEEEEIIMFRRGWTRRHARHFGSFEETTAAYPAMRYMFGRIPKVAGCDNGLQFFSIRLLPRNTRHTTDRLQFHVYGLVAARDSLDPRRNFLFHHTRDNCQILTQQDPFLVLTGSSHAIVLIDPVQFEVKLKAKATKNTNVDDQDKILNFGVVASGHASTGQFSTRCISKRSELEFSFSLLQRSIEVTISVQVVDGLLMAGSSPRKACFPYGQHKSCRNCAT